MSFNRENVIWQSEDGRWNRGFYTVYETGWGEDSDPEWDVEYDFGSFNWVVTGLRSEGAAEDAWHGANPGSWDVVTGDPERAAKFDAMAKALRERVR